MENRVGSRRGGPQVGRSGRQEKVYLHYAIEAFYNQWEGDNLSQKLANAAIDLERFMPYGPSFEKDRREDGRYQRHSPRLPLLLAQRGAPQTDG